MFFKNEFKDQNKPQFKSDKNGVTDISGNMD